MPQTPGQVAYEAWMDHVGNARQFHLLPDSQRAAWQAAAAAVTNYNRLAEARTLEMFPEPTAKKKRGPRVVPGYKELMFVYNDRFETTFGRKAVFSPRAGKAAKEILMVASLEDAKLAVNNAFADPWFVKHSPELGTILASLNKYIAASSTPVVASVQPTIHRKPDYL